MMRHKDCTNATIGVHIKDAEMSKKKKKHTESRPQRSAPILRWGFFSEREVRLVALQRSVILHNAIFWAHVRTELIKPLVAPTGSDQNSTIQY